MFRVIGIIVVCVVIYLGFDAIQRWYSGDATPKEAVTEIRKKVGEKITGDK